MGPVRCVRRSVPLVKTSERQDQQDPGLSITDCSFIVLHSFYSLLPMSILDETTSGTTRQVIRREMPCSRKQVPTSKRTA
jgi:hypothetical protein